MIRNRRFDDKMGGEIVYEVGQPMGMKSSFPMLALTHHIIVTQAAMDVGIQGFKDYQILGDDIVIANDMVSSSYKSLIERLGMSINPIKSIVPKDDVVGAEFASRLALNGKDLSPYPIKLLAKVRQDGGYAGDLQNELEKRGLITYDS